MLFLISVISWPSILFYRCERIISGDEKDSVSDIEDDVSLLDCAKIVRLSHSPKDGYRGRVKNAQTQSCDKIKGASAEVLMVEDDEEYRSAIDENVASKHSPRDPHHISDEPEFPIGLERNAIHEQGYDDQSSIEASVVSRVSSKSAPMESLYFSKAGDKVVFPFKICQD